MCVISAIWKVCFWYKNTPATGGNKVKIGYFLYKGHCQGHKVIDLDVNWTNACKNEVAISYGSKVIAKVKVFSATA